MQIQKSKRETSTGAAVQITADLKLGPGEYLLGVELIEQDSSGNQVYDVALIALSHPGGAGIDLKFGHIGIGGSMRWAGRLRPTEPITLVGYFAFPASGNTCELRYMTGGADEVAAPDGPTVVQIYPVGKPRIVAVDGAATVTPQVLRPAVNTQWQVLAAQAWHDDGTARVCSWDIYDGTNTVVPNQGGVSTAQYVTLPLASSVSTAGAWQVTGLINPFPLPLTYDVYARFNAASLAAGKKAYIRAFVLEFGGGT